MKDFFAPEATPVTAADKARVAAKGAKDALGGAAGKSDKDSKLSTKVGDVSGTKPTSINVTIQKLTGIETLHTTTFKEGTKDMERMVKELLLGALGDVQIMAGQN
jgi:hypothetical protein